MASEDKVFEVEFTEECIEEMADIYDYISIELKEDKRKFLWKGFLFKFIKKYFFYF